MFNSLTGIHTSDNATYRNEINDSDRAVTPSSGRRPLLGRPAAANLLVGAQNFSTANDPDFRDPYTQQWSFTIERELNRFNSVRLTYSGSHSVFLTTAPDLNQIQPNTIGFANLPRAARPFPNWNRVNTRDNGGNAHYHDLTVQFKGKGFAGLSYTQQLQVGQGHLER